MKKEHKVSAGDIVLSLAGRDKDVKFLVVYTDDKNAYITDGKVRKVLKLKKKNTKHLKVVSSQVFIDLAEQIMLKKPVSNERVKKAIK